MRGLRLLPLVLLAACAELSGLSQLGVDAAADAANDGAALNDASVDAATNDVLPLVDVSTDGPQPTFCTLQTQPYVFCADFDEGDVGSGFGKNGTPTPWSSISKPAPALTTSQLVSAPASGYFLGTSNEVLGLVATPPGLSSSSINVAFQVRVESISDAIDSVLLVQLNASYSLAVVMARGTTGYVFAADEVVPGFDGGPSVVPHAASGTFALAKWYAVTLAISSSSVTATFDKTVVTFSRLSTTTTELKIDLGATASAWTNEVDNFVLATN